MHNMKKNDGDRYVENSSEVPKLKRRNIVSWSSEDDDILREQIEKHGTDNWAIIASKFKDKTTRQCRRRWYTYLNSDFKKGGWSPEEDLLLCEAQKIFGNRWTEIAKVVSGRTDNAVKNRFSTLCKKRAKHEALATENNEFINLNNKRVVFPNGFNIDRAPESGAPLKKMRQRELHISSPSNSDYSSGSTRLSQPDYGRIESSKAGHDALLLQNIEAEVYSTAIGDQRTSEPVQENCIAVYENNDLECSSPIQVTPLFRSLAAVVPTPNFSESERRFLLSALGLESTSPKPSGNTPKHPPCKRVLLHSL